MSNASESMMSPQDSPSNRYSNYGTILFISFLSLVIIISFISVVWKQIRFSRSSQRNQDQEQYLYESSYMDQDTVISMENGVSDATLDSSYPKFLCSEADGVVHGVSISSLCCSICLGEYDDAEMLRLLPSCGHLFHQKCIDPWLRLHSTCPVCRTYSAPNTPNRELPCLPESV